jgi:hypothetical protein
MITAVGLGVHFSLSDCFTFTTPYQPVQDKPIDFALGGEKDHI